MKQVPQNPQEAHMQLQDLATYAVIIVVVAVVIAFGQKILTDIGAGFTANTAEANSTSKGKEGLGKFSDYLPTVAIVLVAGFLITVLYKVFLGQRD